MTILWITAAIAFTVAIHFRLATSACSSSSRAIRSSTHSASTISSCSWSSRTSQVPEEQRTRVLFWGILTAIVLRLVFIGAGAVLLRRLHWFEYVLAAALFATASA